MCHGKTTNDSVGFSTEKEMEARERITKKACKKRWIGTRKAPEGKKEAARRREGNGKGKKMGGGG